jgi:ubiquinone biosynthesis protein UbiJ
LITTLALNHVAALINHALAFDPASSAALARLAGRTLAVHCTGPAFDLGVHFDSSGQVAFSRGAPERAEVSLKGSALALARLGISASGGVTLAGSGVEMAGNQGLLQEVRAVLGKLDIDWEAALAGLVGDVPAHLVATALRRGSQWQRQAAARAFSGGAEFLREEAGIVIGRRELTPWADAVTQLAEDSDRLAARIGRLRRRLDDRIR